MAFVSQSGFLLNTRHSTFEPFARPPIFAKEPVRSLTQVVTLAHQHDASLELTLAPLATALSARDRSTLDLASA